MSLAEVLTSPEDAALGRVLSFLAQADYRFVMPTPATHALVSERRAHARPDDLRDVFGWTRTFAPSDVPEGLFEDLRIGGVVTDHDESHRLTIRVSTIADRLHIHSAAGSGRDAVFLGPDSYRFVRLIEDALADGAPVARAVDIGVGAGAGALAVAALRPEADVWATDVNPEALRFLALNAAQAGANVIGSRGEGLSGTTGAFDLIIANPPYIAGREGRTYRDGGDMHGAEIALTWAEESLERLAPGGRFVLYTGSPIIEGRDVVQDRLQALCGPGFKMEHREIDPDVFGGTLRRAAYADVERIAAIGVAVRRCA